jgi:hypothetical protein
MGHRDHTEHGDLETGHPPIIAPAIR